MAMGPKRVKARMESSSSVDVTSPEFRTDDFRMFRCKVGFESLVASSHTRLYQVMDCPKRFSHDWTTCPFAHYNEKARRRDPRTHNYTGVACPYIRQDHPCPYGEHCHYAHNVFEYWLHPSRYRTQLCNIAASCNRSICFFAHTIEELRVPQATMNEMNYFPMQSHQTLNQSIELGHLTGELSALFVGRAKVILEQLLTSRPVSIELGRANTPMQDMSEIQLLITLVQQQEVLAGISDQTPEIQMHFLDQLLRSLYQEACQLLQPDVRERLKKLIEWMYVQLVRNKASLFSGNESLSLFTAAPDADPLHQLLDPIRRQSLGRIPELSEANMTSLPSMRPSQELSLGLNISSQFEANIRRSNSLERGMGMMPGIRLSDESSGTRMSRTSGSPSMPRSSIESEIFNRRSGNAMSQDSSRMSWDDVTPDFILTEYLNKKNPPPY